MRKTFFYSDSASSSPNFRWKIPGETDKIEINGDGTSFRRCRWSDIFDVCQNTSSFWRELSFKMKIFAATLASVSFKQRQKRSILYCIYSRSSAARNGNGSQKLRSKSRTGIMANTETWSSSNGRSKSSKSLVTLGRRWTSIRKLNQALLVVEVWSLGLDFGKTTSTTNFFVFYFLKSTF